MKRLTIALFFVAAFSVSAQDDMTTDEYCSMTSGFAEQIMTARHEGVPMSKAMRLVNDTVASQGVPESIHSLLKSIVVKAYEEPRYTTEQHIKRSATEFSNETYLQCYKALTE